ncbi:MAG: tRNA (adenosine(37)-N6)-threonylcarbamoyltransferase complex transferase subunit TsaD, partial [Gemmatimonadota bacterium]|nr:tRNA (adenosine(37)-N6)-threonylcarbamoyltransferase complex transferase subunit TsaD [Gemmatimonadota bacterium]
NSGPLLRPVVLGLETSCDETSAAVLDGGNRILGHVILSQDVHEVFGGVVPELAARAHLQKVDSVVSSALGQAGLSLTDVDVVGVTAGPGLIGALLVGVCWAKALAFALSRPLVPVHHMEAHLFAPSLEDPEAEPPFVALLVSGGHTLLLHADAWGSYRLLGETRDDAAGEAFDKVAKLLDLPYPGGPQVERLAREGDPQRHHLPRPMLRGGQRAGDADFYDFSFSGLKTAAVDLVRVLELEGRLEGERAHVATAFQEAAVDVLASKVMRAVEETGCRRVLLGGGVSANGRLKEALAHRLGSDGRLFHASARLSLDNGAMVARAARFRFDRGEVAALDVAPSAGLSFPGLSRWVA